MLIPFIAKKVHVTVFCFDIFQKVQQTTECEFKTRENSYLLTEWAGYYLIQGQEVWTKHSEVHES